MRPPSFLQRLQREGLQVRRFAEGFPEWRAAGLPVAANGAAHEQDD